MRSVEDVLKMIFSNPTAPYREQWVLQCVKDELEWMRVPYFEDAWGNVIAGARNARELKHSRKVGLMAHTDHPGFHLLNRRGSKTWTAKWLGGCPPKIHRARLAIYHPLHPKKVVRGRVASTKLNSKGEFRVEVAKDAGVPLDSTCFGAFDYPGYLSRKQRIVTRAADDLAGVVIILATMARLNKKQRKNMLGVFTRAEEVGFRGALGVIYKNVLGSANSVISLEASRQLPGARLGQGPVIRLGDKRTLFDSFITARLDEAAAVIRKRSPKFKVQRRIMNGGTCEATPFNLHRIKASGLAVPLGNYHNQRPNGKPGPEFIDLRDVEGAVRLCVEFFKQTAINVDPVGAFIVKLKRDFKKDAPMLKKRVKFEPRNAQ
jgi:endoglucanase